MKRKKKKYRSRARNRRYISEYIVVAVLIVFIVILGVGIASGDKNNSDKTTSVTFKETEGVSLTTSTTAKVEENTIALNTEESIVDSTADNSAATEADDSVVVVIPTTTQKYFEPTTISIVAVGDNLIHSQIYNSSVRQPDGSYDFSNIFDQNMIDIMSSADLTIVNQETPACGNGYGVSTYPNFNVPTESIDALVNILGADVLTLATNHSYDKDEIGVTGTLNYIHTHYPNVLTSGTYDSYEASEEVPIIEVKGIKIAVLNYTYGLNYPYALPNPYMVNQLTDIDKITRDFAKAREQADFIICCPHWGDEYHTTYNDFQRNTAQMFADLGADLILGSHPHVCQQLSYVTSNDGRNVPVYYSLGNFLSAQNVSPRTLGGMAKLQLYVDERGNIEITNVDYDFTCTYYTITDVAMANEVVWYFDNFKNYMLRDFPVYLEGSSGIRRESPEYTHLLYVDMAKTLNPNWS